MHRRRSTHRLRAQRLIVRLREERGRLPRFIASRLLWHSGLGHRLGLETTLPEGPRVAFDRSSIAACLWLDPHYGEDDRIFLQRYLRPGDTVVDVGANIGHLALVAGQAVGPSGTVLAIEAHPRSFAALAGNVQRNGMDWISTRQVAVGAAAGTVTIGDAHADNLNAVGEPGPQVPLRPLDELAPAGAIALLKLDVEGYELEVLAGAADALRRTACVYFEVSQRLSARFGYGPERVLAALTHAGFTVLDPTTLAPPALPIGEEPLDLVAARDEAAFRARMSAAPVPAGARP